jgi:Family of unknown function (DUF6326)
MSQDRKSEFESVQVPTPIRLALLWAALMGLYMYNDYFSLYVPGTIEEMSAGIIGPLGTANDTVLVIVALVLAIPAMMIFLSVFLPAALSRWSNIFLGVVYTVIEGLTFIGSRPFYQMVVAFEIVVTLLVVWTAWRWPRAA